VCAVVLFAPVAQGETGVADAQSDAPRAQDHTSANEAADVARLMSLLTRYHTDLEEQRASAPTADELEKRSTAQQGAAQLANTPYNPDKIRLNGAQGSSSLAQISQRLSDDQIPESRRDIAPICSIKTRLFGSLIASENRSLKPVGKNQYVARIRLQPGDTALSVQSHKWDLQLPQHISADDYLVTLFLPRSGTPELHVFAIDDLLAQEPLYLPAWLPDELNIKPRAG
jgi:hypothetical protein